MKNRCCFIIPYFGHFKNYFQLFLKTCSFNKDFSWLIITDDNTNYDYPSNFVIKYTSYEKLVEHVSSKFDFPIDLTKNYKLCDLKPAYGYIFEDYIKEYDFWGHCDTDMLVGNLSQFITDEMLSKYDKLFCVGHMSLYRNTSENNRIFMNPYKNELLFKKVFQISSGCNFDEEWTEYNINRIFLSSGKKVFRKDLALNVTMSRLEFVRSECIGSDLYPHRHGYKLETFRNAVYLWNGGEVYRLYKRGSVLEREDFMYFHLQSRNMEYNEDCLKSPSIKIEPNRFIPLYDCVNCDNIELHYPNLFWKILHFKCTSLYNKVKRRLVGF